MFYLRIDEKTLIRRVLQSRGMDYWESGMDMKLGDDIYESFRAYQRSLLREYASMADEFGFRVLDARRKVDVIQDELRRQIGAFLAESDTAVGAAPSTEDVRALTFRVCLHGIYAIRKRAGETGRPDTPVLTLDHGPSPYTGLAATAASHAAAEARRRSPASAGAGRPRQSSTSAT